MNDFSSLQNNPLLPPAVALNPREGQKNYVFVDEHNRHKRLKVIRACAGCRKRKIKCDAATTNTWPCSACTRLKLQCVPPTFGQESNDSAAAAGASSIAVDSNHRNANINLDVNPVAAAAAAAASLPYGQNHPAGLVSAAPDTELYGAGVALNMTNFDPMPDLSNRTLDSDHNAAANAAAVAAATHAANQRASVLAAYNTPAPPLTRGMFYQTQPDFSSIDRATSASTKAADPPMYAPLSSQSMGNLRQFSQSAGTLNLSSSAIAGGGNAGKAMNAIMPPPPVSVNIHDPSPAPRSVGACSNSSVGDISDAFGDLKIDESGIAPYIRQQRKNEPSRSASVAPEDKAKAQHVYDYDPSYSLPDLSLPANILHSTTAPDGSIYLPPHLMPSDEHAMRLFDIFFTHVHPYVPVVHRAALYAAWQRDRSSISPLLLEAVFACAARFDDETDHTLPTSGIDGENRAGNLNEAGKWLALANKHESAFLEEPRLSTVQAMVLLLKAREAMPKRGYYYRSWQSLKTMTAMAKDLDMHEHQGYHSAKEPCGLSPKECLEHTRVWQTLLVLEAMIGGSQGRADFGVSLDTVETRPHWTPQGTDAWEAERSRQFTYFIQLAYTIRVSLDRYHQIAKQPDWGADPYYASISLQLDKWILNLPPDLQIHLSPDDRVPPTLPSHFIANMHSYLHLNVISLCRPLLLASKNFSAGGQWRTHMSRCYTAAKTLCRLQEAIINTYGLNGMLYMQRGVNFSIYSVLACTMIHLVATTSPDAEFNTDSRTYFTRHMRVLERCSAAWPLPTLRNQVDALRVAFSQDVTKPFKLKDNFPYGSPSEAHLPSPRFNQGLLGGHGSTAAGLAPQRQQAQSSKSAEPGRMILESQPMTPPVTNTQIGHDTKVNAMEIPEYMPSGNGQATMMGVSPGETANANGWDPIRIIDQWDMAFPTGGTSSVASSESPSSNRHTSTPEYGEILTPHYMAQYMQQPKLSNMIPAANASTMAAAVSAAGTAAPSATGLVHPGNHVGHAQQQHQQRNQHGLMQSHHNIHGGHAGNGGTRHEQIPHHGGYSLHPVHISAREWQRSVASAFDPHGLKREWS